MAWLCRVRWCEARSGEAALALGEVKVSQGTQYSKSEDEVSCWVR
jgi:hypothetical protein